MHGSGTTNPSKYFWEAMSLITQRSKVPVHMTYRAVGSSTGQKEFVGSLNNFFALNDFGAGDIPMTKSRYDQVVARGRQVAHIPFALGAIGVFHSLGPPGQQLELDLDACLLAKIFSRQITKWDDPEIRAANPNITWSDPYFISREIKVVHRVHGSSSTAGFTSYLQKKCPAYWTLGAGSTITWPAGTAEAQGSGGMSEYIDSNDGAIGYIDAGHGHSKGLTEVYLMNAEGMPRRHPA